MHHHQKFLVMILIFVCSKSVAKIRYLNNPPQYFLFLYRSSSEKFYHFAPIMDSALQFPTVASNDKSSTTSHMYHLKSYIKLNSSS